jgi:hypothetical protein
MVQYKIARLPEQYVDGAESALSELGKDGWELMHIYNHHAYLN